MSNTLEAKAGWTDARLQTLQDMWTAGASATQIAAELGGVTRSAILGKVHRLKLAKRSVTSASTSAQRDKARAARHGNHGQPKVNAIVAAAQRRRTEPQMQAKPFDDETDAGVDVSALMGILDLTERTCKWPHGDPLSPTFGFCGRAKAFDAGPYCPEHAAKSRIGFGKGARP